MSEWRPIETAPKDGTNFQAWCTHSTGGFWEPKARFNPDTGAFEMWGRVDYDMEGWETYPHSAPTHWQPLPEPPSE